MAERYEVRCPPAAKRKLVTIVIGTQSPVVTHHWSCPVCAYITRGGDQDKARVTKEMRGHVCEGTEGDPVIGQAVQAGAYGWCPWTAPAGTQLPSWPVPERYVDPAVARRYATEREARKAQS